MCCCCCCDVLPLWGEVWDEEARVTGMGRNAGAEDGRDDDVCGAAADAPTAAAAAADDEADTKGGESTTMDDGEQPSAATAWPCDC